MKKEINSITIGIAVKSVSEAVRWYKSLLGDVEVIEPAPGTIELRLTDNSWLQFDDTGYLKVGGGSTIVRFETDNIEAEYENVIKLTSTVADIVVIEDVVKYFDFKDPSGNRLSFVQIL